MTRNTRIFMSVIYWAFVVYLFLPLSMMILMGFKDSKFIGFPIKSYTLHWYKDVIQDTEVISIFAYSMGIAIASTAGALFIGTWVAMLLEKKNFRGKVIIFALACLPAVIPGIISAISLRIFAQTIHLNPGMLAIILGHTVHSVPFVALVVLARLNSQPKSHVEAALDLGADNIVAFLRVTLPYLAPSLIGGGIFCMLTSFDDFVRSFFLGGYEPTLPVYIFGQLRTGMSPEINAIAAIVLVLTAIMGLTAERFMRRK
jgi:spermidine/putrescine transport system permease protein